MGENTEKPPVGPLPEGLRGVFASDRHGLLEQYAELLATDGVVRGLIGPREVPRLWERHIGNSGVLMTELPEGASVCDIGSGAGLPGMVIAIARPDLRVTLVEPLLRRTTFLTEVVEGLGLDNVRVVRGRADALHGVEQFDVVTSRAVAPLDRLLEWSMPLVTPTGELLALKGSSVHEEISLAEAVLSRFDCAPPEVVVLGEGVVESPTQAVRVRFRTPAGMPQGAVVKSGGKKSSRSSGSSRSRAGKAKGRRGRQPGRAGGRAGGSRTRDLPG